MLKVFLSYASEDATKVIPFYKKLQNAGFDPWLDTEKLLGGQNFTVEIERAFRDAHVIAIFLSKKSVAKRGFVQREANLAMENLRSKLISDIYIIPILLEQCDVPDFVSERLQYVDANAVGFWDRFIDSLRRAAVEQEILIEQGTTRGDFQVFDHKLSETWEGLPGHTVDISYPSFQSMDRPSVAKSLTHIFAGRAHSTLAENRSAPWNQREAGELFSELKNERLDAYSVAGVGPGYVSISYVVHWYGSGAAHGHNHFESFNYIVVDELLYPITLPDMFEDWNAASRIIAQKCMEGIQREYWEKTGERPDEVAIDQIRDGLTQDQLVDFYITDEGLTLLFPPYAVAPYSLGAFTANVSFFDLHPVMRQDIFNLLH